MDAQDTITDGYSTWSKCGPDCTLEIVRIGKTQCIDLIDALEGVDRSPSTCYQKVGNNG